MLQREAGARILGNEHVVSLEVGGSRKRSTDLRGGAYAYERPRLPLSPSLVMFDTINGALSLFDKPSVQGIFNVFGA